MSPTVRRAVITFVVDEAGRTQKASADLGARLKTWMQGDRLAEFQVRNAGYVSFRLAGDEVQFRFRPQKVQPIALTAGLGHLHELAPPNIIVSWLDRDWHSERFAHRGRAMQRIADLVRDATAPSAKSNYLSRSRKPAHLPPGGPLVEMLERWQSGERTIEALLGRGSPGVDRHVLVDASTDPRIIDGAGVQVVNSPGWFVRHRMTRIADWPDLEYGRWAAQTYTDVSRSAQPLLEDVDCLMSWPLIARQRYAYTRLILPCTTTSGTPLLLGLMVDDASIDLGARVH